MTCEVSVKRGKEAALFSREKRDRIKEDDATREYKGENSDC